MKPRPELVEEVAIHWFLCDIQDSRSDDVELWNRQTPEVREIFRAKALAFLEDPNDWDARFRGASRSFPTTELSANVIYDLAERLMDQAKSLRDSTRKIRKSEPKD